MAGSGLDVGDHAIALETFTGCFGLEAMALASVLAFAVVLCRFAIAIALAIVYVVAMHRVIGGNGFASRTLGGVGSKSGSGQGEQSSGQGKRSGGCNVVRSHEKSPEGLNKMNQSGHAVWKLYPVVAV
jgi:hypothetical protein